MSPFIRKVRTASGATAVQIVAKEHGGRRIVQHLGSAHDEAELAVLMEAGREKIRGGQGVLDLAGLTPQAAGQVAQAVVVGQRSALLWDILCAAYEALGLGEAVGGDEGFRQMVLARLIEPTSKEQVPRVISELGVQPASRRTLFRSLARCACRQWRERIADACLRHVTGRGDLSLCLYDVTTLYFEIEKEDDLRRVGYSKERRVDPQVIVGLLVDRAGFPLQIGCWEGNKAETSTIVPMIEEFREASGIDHLVVVADAGMLSAGNLQALHQAGLGFIVGSRPRRRRTWRRTSPGTGTPWPTGRSSTPSPHLKVPPAGNATAACVMSPCGILPPIRARGAQSGPTARAGSPGTTRPSPPRRTGQGGRRRGSASQGHPVRHHPQGRPGPQ